MYPVLNIICQIWMKDLLLFRENEPESEGEHDAAVAGIAEHDREQEGEGGDGENGRIYFTVRVDSVRVDQVLKSGRVLVCSVEGGRRVRAVHSVQDWWDSWPRKISSSPEGFLDTANIVFGHPMKEKHSEEKFNDQIFQVLAGFTIYCNSFLGYAKEVFLNSYTFWCSHGYVQHSKILKWKTNT